MLSKKSYFKPALFWDDIRRFSPIWVCASLALTLIPFTIWMRYQDLLPKPMEGATGSYMVNGGLTEKAHQSLAVDVNELLLEILSEPAPVFLMLYALVPAMALFAYLCQSRSALGIHALPITRSSLFVTHYIAGLAMAVLPLCIFCVFTIPVLLVINAFWPLVLLTFCGGVFCIYLFFFSFAVFCSMFTGQLWGTPLFYAIFNGIAVLTYFIGMVLAEEYLFGFGFQTGGDDIIRVLTPVWQFCESLWCENVSVATGAAVGAFTLHGLSVVGVYALVGLGFAFLSYCIFSQRHLERAGEIVSVRIMRPIFSICCGVYGGFCLMMLLCFFFGTIMTDWMFFFLLVGAAVGFFAGRMLLEKSVAVFHLSSFKQLAAVLCIAGVCLATIQYDLLGYEEYIPDTAEIDTVAISMYLYGDAITLSGYDTQFVAHTDADVALLRNAHEAILTEYALTGQEIPIISGTTETQTEVAALSEIPVAAEASEQDTSQTFAEQDAYTYVNRVTFVDFTYTLTTGQQITRSYYIACTEDEVARAGSPAAYLETFAASIDLAQVMEELRGAEFYMYLYNQDNGSDSISADAGSSLANGAVEAVLTDIAANGTTLSVLRKDYAERESGSMVFDVLGPIESNYKELAFSEYSYFDVEMRPGSAAAAYAQEKIVGNIE